MRTLRLESGTQGNECGTSEDTYMKDLAPNIAVDHKYKHLITNFLSKTRTVLLFLVLLHLLVQFVSISKNTAFTS